MNAAGLAAGTGSAVTKPSAARISEKAARSITARLRMQRAAICFSKAMANPGFIGTDAIKISTCPWDFPQFKIEGRGLGSALILEFLLYYMTKPGYQLHVREKIYLDNMLDLF